jgi:hypothetical protein
MLRLSTGVMLTAEDVVSAKHALPIRIIETGIDNARLYDPTIIKHLHPVSPTFKATLEQPKAYRLTQYWAHTCRRDKSFAATPIVCVSHKVSTSMNDCILVAGFKANQLAAIGALIICSQQRSRTNIIAVLVGHNAPEANIQWIGRAVGVGTDMQETFFCSQHHQCLDTEQTKPVRSTSC